METVYISYLKQIFRRISCDIQYTYYIIQHNIIGHNFQVKVI